MISNISQYDLVRIADNIDYSHLNNNKLNFLVNKVAVQLIKNQHHYACQVAETRNRFALNKIVETIKRRDTRTFRKIKFDISKILYNGNKINKACRKYNLPIAEFQRFMRKFKGNIHYGDNQPITDAVEAYEGKILKVLVECGCNADFVKPWDCTLLMEALASKDKQKAKMLIDAGADEIYARKLLRKKFLATVCGISGRSDITNKYGTKININLERTPDAYLMSYFSFYIKKYFQLHKTKDFPISRKNITIILEAFESLLKKDVTNAMRLSQIKSGHPCLIFEGSEHHAIALIIYKNKLYICNRGEGAIESGVEIFSLPDHRINVELLDKLSTRYASTQKFYQMIQDCNLDKIGGFEHKAQTKDNCVWAGLKTAAGVFFRLFGDISTNEIYKDFTEFLRQMVIFEFILSSKSSEDNDCIQKIRVKLKSKRGFSQGLLKVKNILSTSSSFRELRKAVMAAYTEVLRNAS